MVLRQKKQHKQRSEGMESAPPEKMEQADALREFIERVEAMAKNNYFSVNLEFAASFLGSNLSSNFSFLEVAYSSRKLPSPRRIFNVRRLCGSSKSI